MNFSTRVFFSIQLYTSSISPLVVVDLIALWFTGAIDFCYGARSDPCIYSTNGKRIWFGWGEKKRDAWDRPICAAHLTYL